MKRESVFFIGIAVLVLFSFLIVNINFTSSPESFLSPNMQNFRGQSTVDNEGDELTRIKICPQTNLECSGNSVTVNRPKQGGGCEIVEIPCARSQCPHLPVPNEGETNLNLYWNLIENINGVCENNRCVPPPPEEEYIVYEPCYPKKDTRYNEAGDKHLCTITDFCFEDPETGEVSCDGEVVIEECDAIEYCNFPKKCWVCDHDSITETKVCATRDKILEDYGPDRCVFRLPDPFSPGDTYRVENFRCNKPRECVWDGDEPKCIYSGGLINYGNEASP